MPDERSPVQHALVLHRVEPDRGIARFYPLLIEREYYRRPTPRFNLGYALWA
jgi:hypothetical protein